MRTEVIDHRAPVMRNEHTVFSFGASQNVTIADAVKSGFLGRGEVNGRLPLPYGLDDSELKIVVRLEANFQECRSPCVAFARWTLVHSAGSPFSTALAL